MVNLSTALKKGRFWITPDPYHNDDNIQIGREVKISCQVRLPSCMAPRDNMLLLQSCVHCVTYLLAQGAENR